MVLAAWISLPGKGCFRVGELVEVGSEMGSDGMGWAVICGFTLHPGAS